MSVPPASKPQSTDPKNVSGLAAIIKPSKTKLTKGSDALMGEMAAKTTVQSAIKPATKNTTEVAPDSEGQAIAANNRHAFFLSTSRNLEKLLAQELADMGIVGAKCQGLGVDVDLTQEEVYRVVYGSRLGSRLLRPIANFTCRDPEELYEQAYQWNWSAILKPEQTLKITASVWDSSIKHSQFAALKLKDAVVDALRDQHGIRPSIDRDTPDIRLDLHLRKDQARVSLYYSDGIMHRRGYRKQAVDAPLKENLAAAILRFANWNGDRKLIDPFCGSGTFLIEAAMIATQTPAGFFRRTQGFETLPDFNPELWAAIKADMDAGRTELPIGLIQGSDIDARALAATRANLESTPFNGRIKLTQRDFNRFDGPFQDTVLIANPPYGVRLEDTDEGLAELYEKLGVFLSAKCPGTRAYVLCPTPLSDRHIGLKPNRTLAMDNGALEVTVGEYLV